MDSTRRQHSRLTVFREFGVNPSVSDSSTYTFYQQNHVRYLKQHRRLLPAPSPSPSNLYLDKALAAMEGTDSKRIRIREWEHHTYAIAIVR
jgi:methionine-gamma-lyase